MRSAACAGVISRPPFRSSTITSVHIQARPSNNGYSNIRPTVLSSTGHDRPFMGIWGDVSERRNNPRASRKPNSFRARTTGLDARKFGEGGGPGFKRVSHPPRSTLASLEAGQREPGLEEGVYLATALGVPLVALLAPDENDVNVRAQRLISAHDAARTGLEELGVQHNLAVARLQDLEAQADALLSEAKRRGQESPRLSEAVAVWKDPF